MIELLREKFDAIRQNLRTIIKGKDDRIELVLIALAAGGSLLLEDVPGVGKTTMAKALSLSINADFSRIQFTPDLLPADILGSSIYNPREGSFDFNKGPVFCNILLADEINRASPRTQSALLEAMNERQATIEGNSFSLPEPFLVIATENPVEYHGTYPLPESQLDRFLLRVEIGYPDPEAELEILSSRKEHDPVDAILSVASREDVASIQKYVRSLKVGDNVSRYIILLAGETRNDSRLRLGVSPRGALMLYRAAQARAFSQDRGYVTPLDVQEMAPYVLSHRILLTSASRYGGVRSADVVKDIISRIKVPD